MQQISGIKTREDALAAIDAIQIPLPQPLPVPPKDDATEAAKAAHANALARATSQNEFAEREAGLISSVKEIVKSRLQALPSNVKVVGLEVRAETGDMEVIMIRIISHK